MKKYRAYAYKYEKNTFVLKVFKTEKSLNDFLDKHKGEDPWTFGWREYLGTFTVPGVYLFNDGTWERKK